MQAGKTIKILFFSYLFISLSLSSSLFASLHFSLQGSVSDNYLGLSTKNSRATSLSAAFDIGTYLRLGVTHRQGLEKIEGYVVDSSTSQYYYNERSVQSYANSIDFTIILYYGRVFVPYVQTGMVKKDYYITSSIENVTIAPVKLALAPVPNAGMGLGIILNKNFSLKLSYSVSEGIMQATPLSEAKKRLDSNTSIGISYKI